MSRVEETLEKLKEELREIDRDMPWESIAKQLMFNTLGGIYENIVMEYKTLILEMEGMEEYPECWEEMLEHPFTHIRAIRSLLEEVK